MLSMLFISLLLSIFYFSPVTTELARAKYYITGAIPTNIGGPYCDGIKG